jgi:hypothetical protein
MKKSMARVAAIENGDVTYVPESPCARGHVDHILPLQGRRVSGLHVPNNLQVIPWKDNVIKSNKYLPA